MQRIWESEADSASRSFGSSIRLGEQLRLIGAPAAIGALLLAGVYLLSSTTPHDISFFTRDPAAIMNAPWYIGQLSTLGVIAWAGAAAIWLFGAQALSSERVSRERRFLLASGLLTLLLLFDDAFMLHESVIPGLLGIPEKAVYLGYLVAGGVYLGLFRRQILRTEFLPAVISGGMLGLSILLDAVLSMSPLAVFAEDGAKFVGIIFWVAYAARVVAGVIRQSQE